jgi:hypothetical protein
MSSAGLHAVRRDRLNGIFPEVDERDVIAVEGGVIVGIDA